MKPNLPVIITYETTSITIEKHSATVWLYGHADQDQTGSSLIPKIRLTSRACDVLGISKKALKEGEAPVTVSIKLPLLRELTVEAAIATDLPQNNQVDVSPYIKDVIENLSGWALLTYDEVPMPVRLRKRESLQDDQVRASALIRAMILPAAAFSKQPQELQSEKQKLHLATLEDSSFSHINAIKHKSRGIPSLARLGLLKYPIELTLGTLLHSQTLINKVVEWVLEITLVAPKVVFRSSEAGLGEDGYRVARLSPQLFPLLGINPGNQIIIDWAGRQAIATALETSPTEASKHGGVMGFQQTETHGTGSRPGVAHHLTIGIPLPLRAELGIPRHAVVNVQWRILPLVLARINELIIPIGALAVAAMAIPNNKAWFISGYWFPFWVLVILMIGLSPIRYRKPPEGRWK